MTGTASAGATCPSAAAIIPSHMIGATAGAASRLAGSEASDTRPKWNASSGAVPSVAAVVMAPASATAPGTRRATSASRMRPDSRRIATTAAKDSCHPGSPAARGLSTSVAAAASSSA